MAPKPEWWEKLPAFKSGDQHQINGVIANNLSVIWAIIVILLMYQVFHW